MKFAAMRPDDAARDRQPKAGAAAFAVARVFEAAEGLERRLRLFAIAPRPARLPAPGVRNAPPRSIRGAPAGTRGRRRARRPRRRAP
jgi:hypothetical protein